MFGSKLLGLPRRLRNIHRAGLRLQSDSGIVSDALLAEPAIAIDAAGAYDRCHCARSIRVDITPAAVVDPLAQVIEIPCRVNVIGALVVVDKPARMADTSSQSATLYLKTFASSEKCLSTQLGSGSAHFDDDARRRDRQTAEHERNQRPS